MFWSFLFNNTNGTGFHVVNNDVVAIKDLMLKNTLMNILSSNTNFYGTNITSQLFLETSLNTVKSNNWNIGIPIYPIGFANSSFQDERHGDRIIETIERISTQESEGVKIRLYSNDLVSDAITSTTQILTTEDAIDSSGTFNLARRSVSARHRNRYGLETDGIANSNFVIDNKASTGSYFYFNAWISSSWIVNNDNVIVSNYNGTSGWYLKSTTGEGSLSLFYTDKDGTEQFAEYYVPPRTYGTNKEYINIGIKFRPPSTNSPTLLNSFVPASLVGYKTNGSYGGNFSGGSATLPKGTTTGTGLTISYDVVGNNIDSTTILIVNRGEGYSVGDEVYIGMDSTMTGDDAPPLTTYGTNTYINAYITVARVEGGRIIDFFINGKRSEIISGNDYTFPNMETATTITCGSQYDGTKPTAIFMDDLQVFSNTFSDSITEGITQSLYNKSNGNCGQGYTTAEANQYKTTGLTILAIPTPIDALTGATETISLATFPTNCIVSNTRIYLRITFPTLTDLTISLDSPSGETISLFDGTLTTNTGGTIDCWFDDNAETLIQNETTDIINGYVNPNEPLSTFTTNNSIGTGNWTLTITNAGADTGTIDAYDLICNYTDIEQPIFPLCEYQFEDILYDPLESHSRNKLIAKDTISLSIIGTESNTMSAK